LINFWNVNYEKQNTPYDFKTYRKSIEAFPKDERWAENENGIYVEGLPTDESYDTTGHYEAVNMIDQWAYDPSVIKLVDLYLDQQMEAAIVNPVYVDSTGVLRDFLKEADPRCCDMWASVASFFPKYIHFNIADTDGDAKSYFDHRLIILPTQAHGLNDKELLKIGVVGTPDGKAGELVQSLIEDENSELMFHLNPYPAKAELLGTNGLTPVKLNINGAEVWYFSEYFDMYNATGKEDALVVGIVDGDTISVDRAATDNVIDKVRLLGLDAPEIVDPNSPPAFFGPEAAAFAKTVLDGCEIKLSYDRTVKDDKGRLLCYAWLPVQYEGQTKHVLFNLLSVLNGYGTSCSDFDIEKNSLFMFQDAQMFAEDNEFGLWESEKLGTDYNFMIKLRGKRNKHTLSPGGSAAKLLCDCFDHIDVVPSAFSYAMYFLFPYVAYQQGLNELKNQADFHNYAQTVAAKFPSTVIIELNAQIVQELGEDAVAGIINSRIRPFLESGYTFQPNVQDHIPEFIFGLPDVSEGIKIFNKILLGEKPPTPPTPPEEEEEPEPPAVSDPVIEEPKVVLDTPVLPPIAIEAPEEPEDKLEEIKIPEVPSEPTPEPVETVTPVPSQEEIEKKILIDWAKELDDEHRVGKVEPRNVYAPDDIELDQEYSPTPGQKPYTSIQQAIYSKPDDPAQIANTLGNAKQLKQTEVAFVPTAVKTFMKDDITIIGTVGLIGGPTSISVTTIPKVVDMNSTVVGIDSRDYGYAENVMTISAIFSEDGVERQFVNVAGSVIPANMAALIAMFDLTPYVPIYSKDIYKLVPSEVAPFSQSKDVIYGALKSISVKNMSAFVDTYQVDMEFLLTPLELVMNGPVMYVDIVSNGSTAVNIPKSFLYESKEFVNRVLKRQLEKSAVSSFLFDQKLRGYELSMSLDAADMIDAVVTAFRQTKDSLQDWYQNRENTIEEQAGYVNLLYSLEGIAQALNDELEGIRAESDEMWQMGIQMESEVKGVTVPSEDGEGLTPKQIPAPAIYFQNIDSLVVGYDNIFAPLTIQNATLPIYQLITRTPVFATVDLVATNPDSVNAVSAFMKAFQKIMKSNAEIFNGAIPISVNNPLLTVFGADKFNIRKFDVANADEMPNVFRAQLNISENTSRKVLQNTRIETTEGIVKEYINAILETYYSAKDSAGLYWTSFDPEFHLLADIVPIFNRGSINTAIASALCSSAIGMNIFLLLLAASKSVYDRQKDLGGVGDFYVRVSGFKIKKNGYVEYEPIPGYRTVNDYEDIDNVFGLLMGNSNTSDLIRKAFGEERAFARLEALFVSRAETLLGYIKPGDEEIDGRMIEYIISQLYYNISSGACEDLLAGSVIDGFVFHALSSIRDELKNGNREILTDVFSNYMALVSNIDATKLSILTAYTYAGKNDITGEKIPMSLSSAYIMIADEITSFTAEDSNIKSGDLLETLYNEKIKSKLTVHHNCLEAPLSEIFWTNSVPLKGDIISSVTNNVADPITKEISEGLNKLYAYGSADSYVASNVMKKVAANELKRIAESIPSRIVSMVTSANAPIQLTDQSKIWTLQNIEITGNDKSSSIYAKYADNLVEKNFGKRVESIMNEAIDKIENSVAGDTDMKLTITNSDFVTQIANAFSNLSQELSMYELGADLLIPTINVVFSPSVEGGFLEFANLTQAMVNTIIGFEVVHDMDSPASTCVIKFIASSDRTRDDGSITLKSELAKIIIGAGTNVSLYVKYGNTSNMTSLVFQGRVTNMQTDDAITIIAESFGADLLKPIFKSDKRIGGLFCNPRDMVVDALVRTESPSLGMKSNFLQTMAKLFSQKIYGDDSVREMKAYSDKLFFAEYRALHGLINVYFPYKYWGLNVGKKLFMSGQYDAMQHMSYGESYFHAYHAKAGSCAWDVVKDALNRVPGYVAYPVNYGIGRQTLFFGKPEYRYKYLPGTVGSNNKTLIQQAIQSEAGQLINSAVSFYSSIIAKTDALLDEYHRGLFQDYTDLLERIGSLEALKPDIEQSMCFDAGAAKTESAVMDSDGRVLIGGTNYLLDGLLLPAGDTFAKLKQTYGLYTTVPEIYFKTTGLFKRDRNGNQFQTVKIYSLVSDTERYLVNAELIEQGLAGSDPMCESEEGKYYAWIELQAVRNGEGIYADRAASRVPERAFLYSSPKQYVLEFSDSIPLDNFMSALRASIDSVKERLTEISRYFPAASSDNKNVNADIKNVENNNIFSASGDSRFSGVIKTILGDVENFEKSMNTAQLKITSNSGGIKITSTNRLFVALLAGLTSANGCFAKVDSLANSITDSVNKRFSELENLDQQLVNLAIQGQNLEKLLNSGTRFSYIPISKETNKFELMNIPGTKPFRQSHYIGSMSLLGNTIAASKAEIANEVVLYTKAVYDDWWIPFKWFGALFASLFTAGNVSKETINNVRYMVYKAQFDDDIRDENVIAKHVIYEDAKQLQTKALVATSVLDDSIKRMYAGYATILGRPTIKPHDIVYINDARNGMSGAFGVKEVIHSFGKDSGFTTMVRPYLLTEVRDVETKFWAVFSRALINLGLEFVLSFVVGGIGAPLISKITTPFLKSAVVRSAANLYGSYLLLNFGYSIFGSEYSVGASRSCGISSNQGTDLEQYVTDEASDEGSYFTGEFQTLVTNQRVINPIAIYPLQVYGIPLVIGLDGMSLAKKNISDIRHEDFINYWKEVARGVEAYGYGARMFFNTSFDMFNTAYQQMLMSIRTGVR